MRLDEAAFITLEGPPSASAASRPDWYCQGHRDTPRSQCPLEMAVQFHRSAGYQCAVAMQQRLAPIESRELDSGKFAPLHATIFPAVLESLRPADETPP